MLRLAHDKGREDVSCKSRTRQAEDSGIAKLSFLQHDGLRLVSVSIAIL